MSNQYLSGKSHTDGGIPAFISGSSKFFELEAGEFVVSRSNAQRPSVKFFLEALTNGEIDEDLLVSSVITPGTPTSPSQRYFDGGGEISDDDDGGAGGSDDEGGDGGSSDSNTSDDDHRFTQDDLDTFVKNRLGKETRKLQRQFDESFSDKMSEMLKKERESWEQELASKSADKLKREEYDESTKMAISQEKRKWEAKYDADTKALAIQRDNFKTELAELNSRFDQMREKQKLSLIRTAMMEGKISDRFISHLLPSLQSRVEYSDEFDDYVVLETAGDMDSVIYNPKDKAKGVYNAGEWIRDRWANEADIKPLRSDFKSGPGAPSAKGGDTGRSQGDPGKSRIERGLRQVTAGGGS